MCTGCKYSKILILPNCSQFISFKPQDKVSGYFFVFLYICTYIVHCTLLFWSIIDCCYDESMENVSGQL